MKKYQRGNDFNGITIRSTDVHERIKTAGYPYEKQSGATLVVRSPEGYPFFIVNEPEVEGKDPMAKFGLNVTDLKRSIDYWHGILTMKLVARTDASATLSYDEGKQASLDLVQLSETFNRGEAYGRIAFGVPWNKQEEIDAWIKENKCTILTNLVTLDTPGKASVRVIILADPDGKAWEIKILHWMTFNSFVGHEICFVDEEGFGKLSEFDPEAEALLDKYIKKDPFEKE